MFDGGLIEMKMLHHQWRLKQLTTTAVISSRCGWISFGPLLYCDATHVQCMASVFALVLFECCVKLY